jgi:hypothetical protein
LKTIFANSAHKVVDGSGPWFGSAEDQTLTQLDGAVTYMPEISTRASGLDPIGAKQARRVASTTTIYPPNRRRRK